MLLLYDKTEELDVIRSIYYYFVYFQGKVEMEIELITKDEADVRPAGKARDEPNMNPVLEPPK
jgi:hypothetical protein